MKWLISAFFTTAIIGLCLNTALAQAPKNLNPPPLPKPDWVKLIDQGSHDPRLKGYFTPEGLKVEIVADFPTVVNPVGMTFGPDGTLYVLEWTAPKAGNFTKELTEFTYQDGSKRKFPMLKKRGKDAVKILYDKKGRGIYDEARVILEEELPSGLLIHDGYLYVTGQGTVRRYKQAAPEGPYGKAEVLAQGFGGFGHKQVSGLAIGNDGWLYLTAGSGDHFVEGSDGSRVDALGTGVVFRCRPDGSKLHLFALGFCNPYRDVAFDNFFNLFHADNDSVSGPKSISCRLLHVAEKADFGWQLQKTNSERGAMPPVLQTGRGAPSGLMIYNDTFFPETYRGLLYYPDVLRQSIRAYQAEKNGATFAATHEFTFLKSDDPLFRPCQMVVGPDGAMYVCDWRTDSGGAGKFWGDGKHGRIYRITWSGTPDQPAIKPRSLDSWARFGKQSDAELLKTLDSDNFTDRHKAQQELARRGATHRKQLLKVLLNEDRPLLARVAALGALQSMWNDEVSEVFQELLAHPENELRRLAAEGLALNVSKGDRAAHQNLIQALNEEDPAVKRALVLALGKIGAAGAADTLANVLKHDDGKDQYLYDGILRGLERLGKPGMDALLNLAHSGLEKDLAIAVKAFTALRSPFGADALPDLLKNVHLTGKQRVALIESYNNYFFDPPVSLAPVAYYLESLIELSNTMPVTPKLKKQLEESEPVKLACLQVLAKGKELESANTQKIVLELLENETSSEVRLAAIQALADAKVNKAGPVLLRGLTMMGAPRPASEQVVILRALGTLQEKTAVPFLEQFLARDIAEDAGERQVQLEALRTLSLIAPKSALRAAEDFLNSNDLALQKQAILAISEVPAGARLVGQRFLDKKLPSSLMPQVAEVLQRHAAKDEAIAKLLADVMKGK